MNTAQDKKYFLISLCFHLIVLLVLILGLDFASPIPVFENTNKNDVISAVVLGDTQKSKILPQQTPVTPVVQEKKPEPPPEPIVKPKENQAAQIKTQKDVIALKLEDKKKVVSKPIKTFEPIKAKDLLADIQKQNEKQKKLKQKQLSSKFQKLLQEQAEKTMRQQLFDENIKLDSNQTREAQGIIDKYQALIKQAISQKWIIPPQVHQGLHCQLMIHLAPGGTVLDVQVTKASGDPALDSSARAAVFRASPLPVPTDPKQFELFRQFVLKVTPQDVLSSNGVI